jgi:hypothetical protein
MRLKLADPYTISKILELNAYPSNEAVQGGEVLQGAKNTYATAP